MHFDARADMPTMLVELADEGWRPVVHQKTGHHGDPELLTWVAYPESSVREFFIGEGRDPEAAVRALYVHAHRQANGSAPPLPELAAEPATSDPVREPGVFAEYPTYQMSPARLERLMWSRWQAWMFRYHPRGATA